MFSKRFTGHLSPAVAWRIHALDLDPSLIRPTGPKGNILKGDILAYLQFKPQSTNMLFSNRELDKGLGASLVNKGREKVDDLLEKCLIRAVRDQVNDYNRKFVYLQDINRYLLLDGVSTPPTNREASQQPYLSITKKEKHQHTGAPHSSVHASIMKSPESTRISITSTDPKICLETLSTQIHSFITDPYKMLL